MQYPCLLGTLAVIAACGRIGFDPPAGSGSADAAIDVTGDATIPSPIHVYPLSATLADDLGGPPLQSSGGTFVASPLPYAFGTNQGLAASGVVPPAAYSIDMSFALDDVTGYRKIIDFKARGSDAGLYVYDTQLQFVVIPITGCPGNDCYTSAMGIFANDVRAQVTLTRDAAGNVAGYVNRTMVFSFLDDGAVGTFDQAGAEANFYFDDNVTSAEAGTGQAGRIRIYDVALTPAQLTP